MTNGDSSPIQRFTDARIAFRGWRRSRPFWGGFLLVLAGFELLSLPLSGVLLHGALKLVIYIGIGGVFGVLIGILLIAAGVLCWVSPAQRVFYGIAGIVLGILSFPASNLGGFFFGMLMAIVGGSLAFAWTPIEPQPAEETSAVGRGQLRGSAGHRALAVATMPAMLVAGLIATPAHPVHPISDGFCILGICIGGGGSPPPSPGPTPKPKPHPSPSPAASHGPQPQPSPSSSSHAKPGHTPSPQAGKGKGPHKRSRKKVKVASSDGLTASTSISVLKAGSATLTHFIFDGIVNMPVAGGTEKMLKFSADSADMTGGVRVSVTENGHTLVTDNSTLTTSGGLTLYATKLVGTLTVAGTGLVTLTFTPTTIDAILLKFVNLLTGVVPIAMTHVTTDQFLISAASQVWGSPVEGFLPVLTG
jgi:hypothetical protein